MEYTYTKNYNDSIVTVTDATDYLGGRSSVAVVLVIDENTLVPVTDPTSDAVWTFSIGSNSIPKVSLLEFPIDSGGLSVGDSYWDSTDLVFKEYVDGGAGDLEIAVPVYANATDKFDDYILGDFLLFDVIKSKRLTYLQGACDKEDEETLLLCEKALIAARGKFSKGEFSGTLEILNYYTNGS